jgi:hypothetical protein
MLFWLNTVLVGWFFIALSGLNLNPATSGLLLLALLCAWPSLNNLPQVWQQQRFWLLGLILYGLFMIGYRLFEGSTDLSSLDRPARFIAMALVMLYLLRFGFCGRYLWLAVMLGTLTGSALGLYEVFMTGSKRAGVGVYPITFGYLMTAMSLLCFFYARYETARYRRILLAMSGLLGIFGAFSSGTRGVVVILAVVLLVVMWRSLRHNPNRWRWLSAVAGGAGDRAVAELSTDAPGAASHRADPLGTCQHPLRRSGHQLWQPPADVVCGAAPRPAATAYRRGARP